MYTRFYEFIRRSTDIRSDLRYKHSVYCLDGLPHDYLLFYRSVEDDELFVQITVLDNNQEDDHHELTVRTCWNMGYPLSLAPLTYP